MSVYTHPTLCLYRPWWKGRGVVGGSVYGRYNKNPRYAACICGGWVKLQIFMALAFYNLRTSAWRCIFDKLKIKTTMWNNCQSDHKPRVIAFSNWSLGIIHKEIHKEIRVFSSVWKSDQKLFIASLHERFFWKLILLQWTYM